MSPDPRGTETVLPVFSKTSCMVLFSIYGVDFSPARKDGVSDGVCRSESPCHAFSCILCPEISPYSTRPITLLLKRRRETRYRRVVSLKFGFSSPCPDESWHLGQTSLLPVPRRTCIRLRLGQVHTDAQSARLHEGRVYLPS